MFHDPNRIHHLTFSTLVDFTSSSYHTSCEFQHGYTTSLGTTTSSRNGALSYKVPISICNLFSCSYINFRHHKINIKKILHQSWVELCNWPLHLCIFNWALYFCQLDSLGVISHLGPTAVISELGSPVLISLLGFPELGLR